MSTSGRRYTIGNIFPFLTFVFDTLCYVEIKVSGVMKNLKMKKSSAIAKETGLTTIQFINRMSPLPPGTTCSKRNRSRLRTDILRFQGE